MEHKMGKMNGGMKMKTGGDQHSTMMSKEMKKMMDSHMKEAKKMMK